jgi:hypothetical protein
MASARASSFFRALHVSAVTEPRSIVIPNKTGKKFPKYCLQPTLEIKIQHSKIEEQVQHGHPKKTSKKASLCTKTGKTHAPRRSRPRTQKPKPDARAQK